MRGEHLWRTLQFTCPVFHWQKLKTKHSSVATSYDYDNNCLTILECSAIREKLDVWMPNVMNRADVARSALCAGTPAECQKLNTKNYICVQARRFKAIFIGSNYDHYDNRKQVLFTGAYLKRHLYQVGKEMNWFLSHKNVQILCLFKIWAFSVFSFENFLQVMLKTSGRV